MIRTIVVSCVLLSACRNPNLQSASSSSSHSDKKSALETHPVETNFLGLALGDSHSCALHGTGKVYCWGDNRSGQVAGGAKAEVVAIPTEVPGLVDVVQIVAAGDYTCARISDGNVACWSGSSPGSGPKPIKGLSKAATDLVVCHGAWGTYGCAQQGGEVSCWGDQYVNNPDGSSLLPSEEAVLIPGLQDASGLACTGIIACARRGPNDALCWGATEDYGMSAVSAVTLPVAVPAFDVKVGTITNYGAISSCRDGACWSVAPPENAFQRSGIQQFSSGFESENAFQLRGIQQFASGSKHGCRLLTDGQIHCEGGSDFGVLGVADNAGMLQTVRASFLAVGDTHSCVIDPRRGVLCWGDNERAQLGDGTWGTAVPRPTKVAFASPVSELKVSRRMSDWPWHTIALRNKQLVWWGKTRAPTESESSPQMSHVDFNGEQVCGATDKGLYCAMLAGEKLDWHQVSTSQFDQISAGGHHFCARDKGGQAWCWGENDKGALGDSSHVGQVSPVRVRGLTKVEQILSGDAHSCARDSSGQVFCWGKNSQGRLGDGTANHSATPVAVLGLSDAIDLSIGKDTTCAVREGGQVSCWGRLFTGASLELRDVPVDSATQVSVGCDHACSLSAAGVVQCWGDNESGQLGAVLGTLETNPAGESSGPYWMRSYLGPSTVAGLPPARKVVAGCSSTCAETVEGELYCWGHHSTIGDEEQRAFRAQLKSIAVPNKGWPIELPMSSPPSGD